MLKTLKKKERAYNLESILSRVLRIGVYISIILMLLGLGLLALKPGLVQVQVLPADQVLRLALKFNPVALINLGVIVLLSTPFIGVLITNIIFIMKKDRIFAIISLAVLAVLFISLAVGSA